MCFTAKDALSSLYPSYVFSTIMGFANFKIQRKAQFVQIEYKRVYNLVSTLLYVCFISFLIGINFTTVGFNRLQNPMQKFIGFSYILLVVGLLSVNLIFNKIHTNSVITLWRKMYQIDSFIKTKGIQLDYKKMKYLTLRFCLTGTTIHTANVIFVMCIQKYSDPLFSFSVYFALNFAVSGFMSVSCTFHSFFLIIGHMFEKILGRLEYSLLRNHRLSTEAKTRSLLETAILHQKLCEIARLANDVTSVQMLASFAASFGLIILQIYSVVTAFNNNKVQYSFMASSLVCVVILLHEKLSLGVVSRRCMGMIPKTREILAKALNLHINDYQLSREINAFNLQIIHDQFEITAGNFFVLDFPVFLTAGNAIITYIILFIQADPFIDLYQSMKETVGAI